MPKTGRSKAARSGKRSDGKSGGRAKAKALDQAPGAGQSTNPAKSTKAAAAAGKRLGAKGSGSGKASAASALTIGKRSKAGRHAGVKGPKAAKAQSRKLKTSVYLERAQARRLARLSKDLGRPQSEIIREAIETYQPPGRGDRNFALARGFARIDEDPRPISEIPESELLGGFGG
jgi:hypothetical protein